MSTIGKVMAMAGIAAAMSESSQYGIDSNRGVCISVNPQPEWKRKKCKTCSKCGGNCQPYNYNGRVLFRISKPKFNACEKYLKRSK